MHGSFNPQSVQEFYSAFDGLSAPNFAEGELYDFSRTAKSTPKPKAGIKKKTSKAEQKLEKAEKVLEMAEALFKEDPSDENYEKVCLAETLLKHTELAFAEQLKSLKDELRYSESYDAMDFTRCVRPDGSVYGSRGKCRKGTETTKPSEQGAKSQKYGDWGDAELRSHANELLNKVDPEKLSDKKRKAFDSQIKDIMSELKGRGLLGKAKAEAPSSRSKTKASKQTKEQTPDEKWMQGRLDTLKTLKGKSKQELLSILSQNRKIHGLTEKDSVRDLKGAILSSIHGNDSPSEIKEKRAAQTARIQKQREDQRQRQEEQSAIDQLSQMLPKGEKIMDSLGDISIATGGAK